MENIGSVLHNLMFCAVYLVITCCHTDLHREGLYSRAQREMDCVICVIAGTRHGWNPSLLH